MGIEEESRKVNRAAVGNEIHGELESNSFTGKLEFKVGWRR